MGRSALLWLLGVPIPIIILIALFWHQAGGTMAIASEHIEIDVDGVARSGDTPVKIAR